MILLKDNTLDGSPIREWQVWWRTPLGLHVDRAEAVKVCEARDMDPELMIVPVAVAISLTGKHEHR